MTPPQLRPRLVQAAALVAWAGLACSKPAAPWVVPGAPTGVLAQAGNGQATVTWAAPASVGSSAIASYTVTVNPSGATVSVTGTLATVLELTNGTAYTFSVHATNAAGSGPESLPAPPVVPGAVPGAPTGVTGSAGESAATIHWQAPTATGGLTITGYTVTSKPGAVTVSTLGDTTATMFGLNDGTSYVFTVHATNADGSGPESPPSGPVIPGTDSLIPRQVTAVPGNAQATVSWVISPGPATQAITGYEVTSIPGGVTSATTGMATTATVHGLTNAVAYTFTVHAATSGGAGPESSASAPVIPFGPSTAPTGVVATPGDAQATVTWLAPANDDGSNVIGYTVTGSDGVSMASTTGATTATVVGLSNGNTYTFTVVATNGGGTSTASAPSNQVTPASVPGAPTAVQVGAVGNGHATVSWSPPSTDGGSSIISYTVTPLPFGLPVTVQGATTTSALLTGLVDGLGYTFTVHATNAMGSGPESAVSGSATPSTVPGAPINVAAEAVTTGATVTWTPPASTGGSPVTQYTVTPFDGPTAGTPMTVSAAEDSATFSDLNAGDAYTFQVVAVNANGPGPAAVSAPITLPTVPDPPQTVSATPGNGVVTVAWAASLDDGGSAITGYTVTATGPSSLATQPLPVSTNGTTAAIVTGLTNGITYSFTVHGTNGVGDGAESYPPVTATPGTVPQAPTNVAVQSTGNGQAVITWTIPDDGGDPIRSFTITPSPMGAPLTITEGNVSAANFVGLLNGFKYTFTVYATNDFGSGPASAPSAPAVPSTTPGGPVSVTATAGAGSATVTWIPPADSGGSTITEYLVYASVGSSGLTGVTVSGTTFQTVVDGLPAGASCSFTVEAVNANGPGPATVSNTVTTPEAPGAPTILSAIPGDGDVTLTWLPPSDDGGSAITGYLVTWSGGSSANLGETSTTVTGLRNGTTYTFQVQAANAAGLGALSTGFTATPGAAALAPTNVTAVPQDGQAAVSWTAPVLSAGALDSYTVTSSPGGLAQATSSGDTTTLLFTGLTDGVAYAFTVHANFSSGTGPESAASTPVTPVGVPDAPGNVVAVPGNAQASLTWSPPASDHGGAITGYTVSTGGVSVATTGGSTNVTVTGLSNGQSYIFTVHATNSAGNSAEAASNAVTLTALPAAPTITGATAGVGSLTVSWTPGSTGGSTIVSYTITPFAGSTSGAPVTVPASTTQVTLVGLAPSTDYTVQVVATSAAGSGPAAVSGVLTTPGAPDAPSAVQVTGTADGRVSVSWTLPASNGGSPVESYTVTPSPAGAPVTVAGPTRASATVTGLVNGTPYTFTVHATNAVGDSPESVSSAPGTPSTLPGAPLQVVLTIAAQAGTVTWIAPGNGGSPLTGYGLAFYAEGLEVGSGTVPGTATQYSVSGLGVGKSYSVTISASNANGQGPSVESNTATAYTTPGAPTDVVATAGDRSASLTFAAPLSDGDATITQYVATSTPGGLTGTSNGSQPAIFVSDLTDGVSYTFVVSALNAAGTGTPSAPSNAVVPSPPLEPPQDVTGVAGDQSVTLIFQPPITIAGVTVSSYTATSVPGGVTASADAGSTPESITVTGLTNGVGYTFTVVANTNAGPTGPSAPSATITPFTLPSAPGAVNVTAGTGSATVTWIPPSDDGGDPIIGYTVTPFAGSAGGTPVSVDGATYTATLSGLTPGASYTFQVFATSNAGNGAPATSAVITLAAGPPSAASSTLTATPGTSPIDASTPATVTLTLRDANGNDVTGEPVLLEVSGPGASLTPTSGSTDSSGTFTAALNSHLAGTRTVTASAGGLVLTTSVTFTLPLCNPAPILAQGTAVPAAVDQGALVAADFNGDGYVDLATADRPTSNVDLRLSNGDGTFTDISATNAVGANPVAMAAADFNGDGLPDVVTANGDGNLSVLLGTGTGFAAATSASAVYGALSSVATGDFNDDGQVDLALSYVAGGAAVMLGNGAGGFAAPTTLLGTWTQAGAQQTTQLIVADFNQDGELDLAVSNLNGFVGVLLGNGDGGFQAVRVTTTDSQAISVAAGDFNGDGQLDLAVKLAPDSSGRNLQLLAGNGDGTFTSAASGLYALGGNDGTGLPSQVVTADFDGDGKLDVAMTTAAPIFVIAVARGNGDGTLAAPVRFASDVTDADQLVVGDFDGDGAPDLASASLTVGVDILLAAHTFQAPIDELAGEQPARTATADFNGDGLPDLVVTNFGGASVSLLEGYGDGTFARATSATTEAGPDAVVTGDFDRDGLLDLALVATGADAVDVLLGQGDGTFQTFVSYPAGSSPGGVTTGDFNGDGVPDLAVSTEAGAQVTVLLGQGDGTFAAGVDYPVPGGSGIGIVTGDFNRDGQLDLVSGGALLMGVGDGTFETALALGAAPSSALATGDFDQDGKPDLALATVVLGGNVIEVLLGNGDGTFATLPSLHIAGAASTVPALDAIDLDGDGRLDLLVSATAPNRLTVLLGLGDGSFEAPSVHVLPVDLSGLPGGALKGPGGISTADFNGDGQLDIAVANSGAGNVSVMVHVCR